MEVENKIPKSCKVVVIGGGVAGCSTAYHLAKDGWKDTVLLERDVLTSGTTWHAAGLIGQLGSSATITKLRNYSLNLYKRLEEETGLSTGLKQNGSLTVATTESRLEELKRQVTFAQRFNIEANEISIDKIKEIFRTESLFDLYDGVVVFAVFGPFGELSYKDNITENNVDWGKINQPLKEENYQKVKFET